MTEKQQTGEKERMESLDRKIEKLQIKIAAKHQEYNALTEELGKLLDERHPERKEEKVKNALYEAFLKSDRSLDEILDLIENADEYI